MAENNCAEATSSGSALSCSAGSTKPRFASDVPARDVRWGKQATRRLEIISESLRATSAGAVAASILAVLSLGVSKHALAQCTGTADSTICTQGGNPYASGINVDTNNGLGGSLINLTLQSGVNVTIPAGSPGVNAVNAANTTGVSAGSANIAITTNGVTIDNSNPPGNNQTGLRIQSSGAAVITATSTTINVTGTASDWAILDFAMPNDGHVPHVASVTYSGPGLNVGSNIRPGGWSRVASRRITAALATPSSTLPEMSQSSLGRVYQVYTGCSLIPVTASRAEPWGTATRTYTTVAARLT